MTGRQLFKYLDKMEFLATPLIMINNKLLKHIKSACYWSGVIIRYYSYRKQFKQCGTNVTIHKNVFVHHPRNIMVGDNVSIHPLCYIDGEGGIEIGSNVSIAHNSTIMSSNHSWSKKDTPIKYCPKTYGKVTIGDDVWIGCGVRIMAGVNIASRCVIAAGAVVTKDCEPNSLYGGVPARKIKDL